MRSLLREAACILNKLLKDVYKRQQVIFVLFGRKWKELDENETNTETAHS